MSEAKTVTVKASIGNAKLWAAVAAGRVRVTTPRGESVTRTRFGAQGQCLIEFGQMHFGSYKEWIAEGFSQPNYPLVVTEYENADVPSGSPAHVERLEARIRDLERQLEAERARVPDDALTDHLGALPFRKMTEAEAYHAMTGGDLDDDDDALPSDFPPPGTSLDRYGNLRATYDPRGPEDELGN